jgi:hypothetical protein
LGWLSDRVRAAFADETAPVRVSFDGVFLVWEGFHMGVDHPLDVRVSDIVVANPAGRRLITAPSAHMTFSLAGLLWGGFVPRTVEVDHARIAVTREPGGAVSLDMNLTEQDTGGTNDLKSLLDQLARPVSSDRSQTHGLFNQIQQVHFRDAATTLRDRETGLIVGTPDMDLSLTRVGAGHVRGTLRASLVLGEQQSKLTAVAEWMAASGTRLDLTLTPFRPSGIGPLPPFLAFVARVDAPVSLTAMVGFNQQFQADRIQSEIRIGQGQFQIGEGNVPVRAGTIGLSGTPAAIGITTGHFDVAHTRGGSPEIVNIGGLVTHRSDRLLAALTLGVSQIDIADLPMLWPPGLGGGARPWVTEHVTGGTVTRGTAAFVIEADDALRDVVVTKASGDLDGTNAIFTWIDNVPPIEQTNVHLHLADPDTLDIHVSSARQRIRNGADLLIKDGQMHIIGLSLHDQIATIRVQIEGPVGSGLTLLKEPRLHLISTHPIALKIGDGDAAATLDFQFPLENRLRIDDVRIHADAHLKRIRVPDVAAGQDLDDGVFDLEIDKNGLTLTGQGSVATVPITVTGSMDFNTGALDQVFQKITVKGQPTAAQLAAAGLPVKDVLGGPIPLTVVIVEHRAGDGSVSIDGDLTQATLALPPLAWSKPSGGPASASANLLMSNDQLTQIDRVMVHGEGLQLSGSVDFVNAHMRTLTLNTIRLGRTQAHGLIRLGAKDPIAVVLQGDEIDLSAKLVEKSADNDRTDITKPVTTPDWTLDARFDRAILANGETARDIRVTATGGGEQLRLLDAAGTNQTGSGFSVKIEQQAGRRHLLVEANDAGSFLRSVDAIRGMKSGHLMIDGIIAGPLGFHPLAGSAIINDIVVKNSPVLGKLLQAITLYGLVDVLRGPGMSFSQIAVPFHYNGNDLYLEDAHAYNASLGLTATGRINARSGLVSLTGTIVPAYFFNAILGQLPLVGKLFSPEKGGGIFAVRFGLDGPIDDPGISINPISALTPGFLREIFGVFNRTLPAGTALPADGK